MVRRGSTVRVRQRASREALETAPFSFGNTRRRDTYQRRLESGRRDAPEVRLSRHDDAVAVPNLNGHPATLVPAPPANKLAERRDLYASPREVAPARIVDLFAGIGCVADGFAAEAFEPLALLDVDARRTYVRDHPVRRVSSRS